LFNVGGMSTGTTQQIGEFQRRQAGTLADLKANRLKNWLGFRGGYEGDIRGFEKDIMGYGQEQRRMVELLRGGVQRAGDLYESETAIDYNKLIQQANLSLNRAQLQDQKRLSKRSLLDRLAPVADFATMAYLGGGGTFGLGEGGFSMDTLSSGFTDPYGTKALARSFGGGGSRGGGDYNTGQLGSFFSGGGIGGGQLGLRGSDLGMLNFGSTGLI
jgi:hypothetical protein